MKPEQVLSRFFIVFVVKSYMGASVLLANVYRLYHNTALLFSSSSKSPALGIKGAKNALPVR